MNLNFLKTIEAEIPQFVNLLQTSILPAFAQIEVAITPETTKAELTATLETDAREYLEKKFGMVVGEILFFVPSVKGQIDKAISYVADKALPVMQGMEKEVDKVEAIATPPASSGSSLAPTMDESSGRVTFAP